MEYPYKLPPFDHQRTEFEQFRDAENRALWWEMGTGKTKPTIDTAAWLFMRGKITGVLVLAPKAVAPNWSRTELPRHLPDEVMARTRVVLWDSARAGTQRFQRELTDALDHDGLLVVCMSYDGIMQGDPQRAHRVKGWRGRAFKGAHFAKELLSTRSTMMVLDESARIKNPGAKRTKRILAAGRYAAYRRALTGTPVTNSPFDVYAQVKFLDPTFWDKYGCAGWPAFKQTFGIWVKRVQNVAACPHPPAQRETCPCPKFPMLVDYRNLDTLATAVQTIGSRLRKDDVLDLPPKLYTEVPFDLTPELHRTYTKLRDEAMVFLAGDMITAPLVITKLLRLQQITSGYCPTDDDAVYQVEKNPRLDALADIVEDVPHSMIIWAKFQQDFDLIRTRLDALGIGYVEYTGRTSIADRETARDRFQKGDVQVFLGNASCAGEGLTLHRAKTVIYYNTSFRLADRLQSEDRAHRAGMDEHPVQYIDVVARDTVDEKIIDALRQKKDLADLILGDPSRNWI